MLKSILYSQIDWLDTEIEESLDVIEKLSNSFKDCDYKKAKRLMSEIETRRDALHELYIQKEALQRVVREYLAYVREEKTND